MPSYQESIELFKQNVDKHNVFLNDPDGVGFFTTTEGEQVQTIPAQSAALAQALAAIQELDPNTVELAYEAMNARDDAVAAAADVTANALQVASNTATVAADKAIVQSLAQFATSRDDVRLAVQGALPANTYNNAAGTITFTATGSQSVDGVATVLGDSIVVTGSGIFAGIYTVTTKGASGVVEVWTRRADSDTGAELVGACVRVTAGTNGTEARYRVDQSSITLGTTVISMSMQPGSVAAEAAARASGDADNAAAIDAIRQPLSAGIYRDAYSTEVAEAVWALLDNYFRSAMVVNTDGSLSAWKLLLQRLVVSDQLTLQSRPLLPADGRKRDTGNPFADAIRDLSDRALLGWDDQGRTSFVPAPGLLAQFNDQQLAESLNWRGVNPAWNIRATSNGLRVATVQDPDGRVYDANQPVAGAQSTAVLRSSAPLRLIVVAGQSNAGKGGSSATKETRALMPGHVLQFAGSGKAGDGGSAQSASALLDLSPAFDTAAGLGQFVATMLGFALEGVLYRNPIAVSPGFLMRTDWYGGQPLSSFVSGTHNWNNTMQALAAAAPAAAKYGRTVDCPWYVWIQGESGPYGRTTYASALGAYIDSIRPALQTAGSLAAQPRFAIVQTNDGDYVTGADTGVSLAQWDVALARAGTGVILAGPMYQCPVLVPPDNIHATSEGRMVLAEMLALVYEQQEVLSTTWNPLQMTNAVLAGANIDITFQLPPGGGPLAFDTSWIAAVANKGFAYSDDSNSASISSVAITGTNTVRVTLNVTPTGANKRIRYAVGLTDTVSDGWCASRGQLISPTGRESYFHRLGYAVPQYINHYAVKSDWTI